MLVVIIQGVLALMYVVDAVKLVRAMVYSKLKCTFYPMFMSLATNVKVNAITAKP